MRPRTDDRTRSRDLAARTLRSLRRHGLAPTPENYQLFYLYHEGSHPALTRELDTRLRDGERLDDAACWVLHARHVGRGELERAVEAAGEQLTELTDRLDAEVEHAEAGMREPARRIGGLAANAARTADADELRRIVARTFAEARAILDTAAALEHRLRVTRAELAAVTEVFLAAKREAETDPLTELPNRRRFVRAAEQALERVRRGGAASVLLLADIDHFKNFNDRHGHVTGDLVLRAVAQLLRRNVKDRDLVSRWGGEEFAILLHPRSVAEACDVAERLRRIVRSRRIRQRNTGKDLGSVTLSMGVGEASAVETLDDWLERVDRALYRAKRRGRDRVELAEPPVRGDSPAELAFTAPADDAPAAAISVPPAPAGEEPR